MPVFVIKATPKVPQTFAVSAETEDEARDRVFNGEVAPIPQDAEFWNVENTVAVPEVPEDVYQQCLQFEYDTQYCGGDYAADGDYTWVPIWLIDLMGAHPAFEATAEVDACHIVGRYEEPYYNCEGDSEDEVIEKWATSVLQSIQPDCTGVAFDITQVAENPVYQIHAIKLSAYKRDHTGVASVHEFKLVGTREDAAALQEEMSIHFSDAGIAIIPF